MRIFNGWGSWEAAGRELANALSAETIDELADAYTVAAARRAERTHRPLAHPLEVLQILVAAGVTDRDVLLAALLHDSRPGTPEELRGDYGDRIAELVAWLTLPDPADETAYLAVFEALATAPPEAVLLALACRYSAVQRLHTVPNPGVQRAYYAQTVKYHWPLARRIPFFREGLYSDWRFTYGYLSAGADLDQYRWVHRLARAAHRGQVDKAGDDYLGHVEGVAANTKAAGGTHHQQLAALLHDVVEDTPVTLEQLGKLGVPAEVVTLVEAMTHRADESREEYLARVAATEGAVLIKRADIAHNTDPERSARLDPATRERLARKYADSLATLDPDAGERGERGERPDAGER